MGYRIEVRDRDLKRIGEIDTWIKLDFTVRYCQAGYWQLLVKADTPQAELLQRGCGVAIWQEGVDRPVLTGQIEAFEKYWTNRQHTAEGSIYVGGECDNRLAYSRLAFVRPDLPVSQQYQSTTDTRTIAKPTGEAIRDELYNALGPGAIANRQVPGLAFPATVPGVGSDPINPREVNDTVRYDVLGAKFEEWLDTTKNKNRIGWRFVYNPDTSLIELDIYEPRDMSQRIRFSKENGNLREFIWRLAAPKYTRAIVGCQGEGKERYFYQRIDAEAEAEWGMSAEVFVDRRDLPIKTDSNGNPVKANNDVTDDEFQAALKAVEEAAESALKEGERNGNFQIYPIDTEAVKFGRDYFVGDIVSVEADGQTYVDIVREVVITVEDGGRINQIQPKIGEQGTGEPLNLYRTVFEMREKLRKLEARM